MQITITLTQLITVLFTYCAWHYFYYAYQKILYDYPSPFNPLISYRETYAKRQWKRGYADARKKMKYEFQNRRLKSISTAVKEMNTQLEELLQRLDPLDETFVD